MLNEHPFDPLEGLIVKNGKLVVSKKKQKEIEKENMLYKNIPPPKFLIPLPISYFEKQDYDKNNK